MEAKIELEVKDIEPVKSLLKLLEDNFKDLPKAVQDGLREINEPEIKIEWLTPTDFLLALRKSVGDISHSYTEGTEITRISISSKKIEVLGVPENKIIDLEHFWIKKGDTIIWEW